MLFDLCSQPCLVEQELIVVVILECNTFWSFDSFCDFFLKNNVSINLLLCFHAMLSFLFP